MKYAFINATNEVVQCVTGTLTPEQQTQFLREYSVLFGATAIVEVTDDTTVCIGGQYTDGVFLPIASTSILETVE